MITKWFVIRPVLLVMSAGVLLFSACDRCLSQDTEPKENEPRQIQILLGAERLDVISPELKGEEPTPTETPMLPPGTESISELLSPGNLGIERRNLKPLTIHSDNRSNPETKYFREQISQQIDFLAQQGNDVQQLRELVERLQLALENSERETTGEVEVAVFAVPDAAQEGPQGPQGTGHPRVGLSFSGPPSGAPPGFGPPGFGPPGFGPPGFGTPALRMGGHAEVPPRQEPRIQHPETHGPEGAFADDRKRIASLTESAEHIAQAGLPDVAHGLRERAGQLERELAEKQERMQQEQRQRSESAMRERQEQTRQILRRQQPQRLMEQRREGIEIELGNHSKPPMRELHEQIEQIRREMYKLSEQMVDLTRLIQQHHNPRNDRGHHDEEDHDEEDHDEEDHDEEDHDEEDHDEDDHDEDDHDEDDHDEDDEEEEDEMEDDDEDHKEREEHEEE